MAKRCGRGMGVTALVMGLALLVAAGCGKAPSIGPDREVFTTVDALYTAVSLEDIVQIDRNGGTLDRLHKEGRLPDDAHKDLIAMAGRAKGGDWEGARLELRQFMSDQRR